MSEKNGWAGSLSRSHKCITITKPYIRPLMQVNKGPIFRFSKNIHKSTEFVLPAQESFLARATILILRLVNVASYS